MPLGSAVDQKAPNTLFIKKKRGRGLFKHPARSTRAPRKGGFSCSWGQGTCFGLGPFKRLWLGSLQPPGCPHEPAGDCGQHSAAKIAGEISPRLVLFKGLLASEARQAVGEAAVVKVAPTRVHVVNAWRCPHVPRRAGLSTASTGMTVVHHRPCGPQGRSAAPEQQFAINSIA